MRASHRRDGFEEAASPPERDMAVPTHGVASDTQQSTDGDPRSALSAPRSALGPTRRMNHAPLVTEPQTTPETAGRLPPKALLNAPRVRAYGAPPERARSQNSGESAAALIRSESAS